MSDRLSLPWLISILFTFLLIIRLPAQSSVVMIKQIADISVTPERLIDQLTTQVQIKRATDAEWIRAAPKYFLYDQDQLKLEKETRVDMILAGLQKGRIVLLPDPPVRRAAGKKGALYQIRKRTEQGREYYDLEIQQGASLIDWLYGKLHMIFIGHTMVIDGTRLICIVDDLNQRALVYLQSGRIHFPSYPVIQVPEGKVVLLHRGFPPQVMALRVEHQGLLDGYRHYNGKVIWSRIDPTPWFFKPQYFVPVGSGMVACYPASSESVPDLH